MCAQERPTDNLTGVPLISVIIPAYNAEPYLEACVHSVTKQSFRKWECIIVNDGSDDDTAKIGQSLADRYDKVRSINQANAGAPTARNTGYRQAHPESRYLFWLDADDCLHPLALEVLVSYMEAHPQVGLLRSGSRKLSADGKVGATDWRLRIVPGPLGLPWPLPFWVRSTPFVTFYCMTGTGPYALYRRSVFEKTELWVDLPRLQDIDMFCQMALQAEVHAIPQKLYYKREHSNNMSKLDNTALAVDAFRERWDNWPAKTEAESQLLREAHWQYYHRHQPCRHVKVGLKLILLGMRKKNRKAYHHGRHLVKTGLCLLLKTTPRSTTKRPDRYSARKGA